MTNPGWIGWVADAQLVVRAAAKPQPDGGYVLLVRDGQILAVEKVSARGREAPLLGTLEGRDALLTAAEKV